MTATYTWDIFSSLDGYGSYGEGGDWGGYWGKQGPELEAHRLDLFSTPQHMVMGANTYRVFNHLLGMTDEEPSMLDDWVTRMHALPTTVVSTTIEAPLSWPDGTLVDGDAVDVVAELKESSDVPLCSHGSVSMNQALVNAGLVDRIRVTVYPVLTGATGTVPIFRDLQDFDLDLVDQRTLDGRTLELAYRPTRHG